MSLNTNKIEKYLDSKNTYEIFDINYTKKEKKCIDNFNITKSGNYTSYNTIDNLLDFIKNIGNNKSDDVDIMFNIIKNLLNNILFGYKTDSYYIILRIQKESTFFDIPRWHCDGFYYANRDKLQTKFVTVLRGPTTLVLDTTKEEKEHFFSLQKYPLIDLEKDKKDKGVLNEISVLTPINHLTDKDKFITDDTEFDIIQRKYIAENIRGTKITLSNNQGIIFVAGDKDKCLIHSEPKFDKARIFLSILPGTKDDMIYMENRQKEFNKKYEIIK
jgi:hypothetical protein